jgi:serine/threonine protein kinase
MSSRPETIVSDAAASTPTPEALVGKRVHKYEIVRVLGHGGMGTVYEALNTAIGKRVAMKFIDTETAQNKEAVARFQREAEAAGSVESAHIVDIFDSGYTADGLPFIVMELLRGEDLGHRIKRCGRLDLPEAVHITAQILRGLHRAHEAGIVHRDLKPDNIFLVDRDDDSSFAKILDFGISKVQRKDTPVHTLTRQGTVLGTPFYMSPEQAQAMSDIDGRTDLWSIGAILYECLTGRPPYNGSSYEQVIVNICMRDAEDVRAHNPVVPEAIAQVIARALTRDRAVRFATARQFLDALKAAAGGMISSRSGPLHSEDSSPGAAAASSSDFHRITPSGGIGTKARGSSPRASADMDGSLEPTLEVNSAGTSKVGWSTSRRAAARRDRRTIVMVAVTALLAGGFGAFMFVRARPASSGEDPSKSSASVVSTSTAAAVQIKPNVAEAKVLVDGVEAPGGLLKGQSGDVKRVRVEAAGYSSSEIEVTLEVGREPLEVNLVRETGDTSPVVTAVPVVVTPVVVTPAAPKATGVGGELKLKTD